MRPKNPLQPTLPRTNTPADPLIQSPHWRPQLPEPPLPQSTTGSGQSGHQHPVYNPLTPGTHDLPRMEVTDLPVTSRETATGLSDYLLSPAFLRNMQPASEDGFRYVVGRKFVDVKDNGTVYVEFDANLGAYRAMDLYKKQAPGPVLFQNPGELTWSTTHQTGSGNPLKRPHPDGADSQATAPAKQSTPALLPAQLKAATDELLQVHFPRLYPQTPQNERVVLLRTFNLSPRQHVRLRDDLGANPLTLPQWVEQHRLRSLDAGDPTRFDALHQEIEPMILPLRNGTLKDIGLLRHFEESISKEFLDGFLTKLGYLRNKNGLIYRTDIPGVFRADERTPFELVDSSHMLPRYKHQPGATTDKPISTTVSLKAVRTYASGSPDPEYLSYNSQRNKYPGKRPGDADDSASDSDSSSSSDNEWSDSAESLDNERNYETVRHDQQVIFTYVLDTRGMEVLMTDDNDFFNRAGRKNGSWLPDDDLEALVSVSRSGIHEDRIWLLNSNLTRAAKVDDVVAQVREDHLRDAIEGRTHRGSRNLGEYDALIDAAERAGKPILKLDAGKDWFANDIVWPQ